LRSCYVSEYIFLQNVYNYYKNKMMKGFKKIFLLSAIMPQQIFSIAAKNQLRSIYQKLSNMKRNILLPLMLLITPGAFSQGKSNHYSISGGILGAMNMVRLNVGGYNAAGLKYNTKKSFGGGLWINFPLSRSISLETQGVFSTYRYQPDLMLGTAFKGSMDYVSILLFLKFHIANTLALTAGAQFDFLTAVRDVNNFSNRDSFMKSSSSLTGGFELFPRSRFTFFGRYLHGLTNMDNTGLINRPELNNRNIQLGFKLKLFGGYKVHPVVAVPIPTIVVPVDTDSDGIMDAEDKCPNQAGLAKYNGCPVPDTDGDGINDEDDKCATQKGLAKYAGCPIPDSDTDGINDEEDKCPDQAGVARYGGCQVPDTDADGINDEDDRCPTVAGVAENKGCPQINYQANEVTFVSGKSVLTTPGKKELDVLVGFLKKNAIVKINLDGYTDNAGTDKINLALSEKRAAAAKKYIVSKGINERRITSAGYGSVNPVAENKTAKGKAKNRRVEVKVQ
jgi:outer membrane protein OmpA-like peptidoglycan-associated protein